jgi:hypothetical protein
MATFYCSIPESQELSRADISLYPEVQQEEDIEDEDEEYEQETPMSPSSTSISNLNISNVSTPKRSRSLKTLFVKRNKT